MLTQVEVITPLKCLVPSPFIEGGEWDGKNWIMLTSIEFILNGKKCTIPAGFVTDFGSIPRIARVTIDKMGLCAVPFVIHDWLREENEEEQVCTTKEADEALYELGLKYGCSKYTMFKIYYSLRMFGWAADVGENVYCKVDHQVIEYICHSNKLKLENKSNL